jgi:gamma-glutamyltranspeptidase/glutathione hydrolase
MKNLNRVPTLFLVSVLLAATATAQQDTANRRPDVAMTLGGVVACDSPAASLVGRDVLQQGGNAVDGAIATAFAMAVTWPEAGNIGGGGFMMVAPTDGDVVCVDYREKAPLAANNNTFVNQQSRHDSRMVGVPGTVRGLALAHEKFGKLPWAELVRPAIKLARDGFVVDDALAGSINYVIASAKSKKSNLYDELIRVYAHPKGRNWLPGDVLVLPDLAETLERIANDGARGFYRGKTAQLLVGYMNNSKGLIVSQDLSEYKAVIRPAIQSEFRGYQVFGAPLPSSGGTTIALTLNILEELGFADDDSSKTAWTPQQLHMIAEATRWAFRERAEHLGDADFVEVPKFLTSKEHAKKIAGKIALKVASSSKEIAGSIELSEGPYESPQTTHFSVIDEEGMAVSNTYTLEAAWGAQVIAPGTGFVLNNEMGDFNWYPGYTNLKGRIGTPPNLVEPGKRMLSSMSPTIVKSNGKVKLVTGTPGGRTIINSTCGILLQRLALGRSLEQAVSANRYHHQWLPDELRLEAFEVTQFGDSNSQQGTVEALREMGHKVRTVGAQGSVHCIEVDLDSGVRKGVSDFRRGGRVQVTR